MPLISPHKPRSVYGLTCPISGRIVYIGVSCRPRMRIYSHPGECRMDMPKSPKAPYLKALDAMGQMRVSFVILTENIPSGDALAWECYWQIFYRLRDPGMMNSSRRDWNHIKRAFRDGHSIAAIYANPWLAVKGGMPESARNGIARCLDVPSTPSILNIA